MKPLAPSFLALFLLLHFSSHFTSAQQDDVPCLQQVKASVMDPSGSLSSWVFGDKPSGYICSFFGVECVQANQNTVKGIKLPAANLGGEFPVNGLSQCTSLQNLDLSNNHFLGGIPTNTCVVIPTLVSLNLSWNSFTGGLSENISSCPHLEQLALQRNQLTGVLPWQIGILPNMTVLDVSFNNFTGKIPSTFVSRSFVNRQGFPASSFEGNSALCGQPLGRTCIGM